jgi:hypothetical protein
VFANHSQYGGPPYNNVNLKACGQPTARACPRGRHISWDGVHNTDDSNAIVASKILSDDFSEPRTKPDALCTCEHPSTCKWQSTDSLFGSRRIFLCNRFGAEIGISLVL